jgi:hypothetical protein
MLESDDYPKSQLPMNLKNDDEDAMELEDLP